MPRTARAAIAKVRRGSRLWATDYAACHPVSTPVPYRGGTIAINSEDASKLVWFRDECLDFVYSSHLLEDYDDTEEAVLREWLSPETWRPSRYLCPDEQLRKHCAATAQPRHNPAHKHGFLAGQSEEILARVGVSRISTKLRSSTSIRGTWFPSNSRSFRPTQAPLRAAVNAHFSPNQPKCHRNGFSHSTPSALMTRLKHSSAYPLAVGK
jgi:hypothetical protein